MIGAALRYVVGAIAVTALMGFLVAFMFWWLYTLSQAL